MHLGQEAHSRMRIHGFSLPSFLAELNLYAGYQTRSRGAGWQRLGARKAEDSNWKEHTGAQRTGQREMGVVRGIFFFL